MSIQDSVNNALGSVANAVQINKILEGQEFENNMRKIQVQEATTDQRNEIIKDQNEYKDLGYLENALAGKSKAAKKEADNFTGKKQTRTGKNTKKYQTLLNAAAEAGARLDEILEMRRDLKYKIMDKTERFNARANAYTKAGVKVDPIQEDK